MELHSVYLFVCFGICCTFTLPTTASHFIYSKAVASADVAAPRTPLRDTFSNKQCDGQSKGRQLLANSKVNVNKWQCKLARFARLDCRLKLACRCMSACSIDSDSDCDSDCGSDYDCNCNSSAACQLQLESAVDDSHALGLPFGKLHTHTYLANTKHKMY